MNDVITADHWRDVLPSQWPFRHFTPHELASHGNGAVRTVVDAGYMLDELRGAVGKPLRINSAYRDPVHNAEIGGAPLSRHKVGDAFDVSFLDLDKYDLLDAAKMVGFSGFGHYQTFLHVDAREHHAEWYSGDRSKQLWIG